MSEQLRQPNRTCCGSPNRCGPSVLFVRRGAGSEEMRNEDTCVFCGAVVPEGLQVCPICEKKEEIQK